MADTPSDRFRARLLDAFTLQAARVGWTDAAFKAAVAEAGLSEGEAALACPKGAADLFDAFAARADEAMLAALEELDLPAMKIRHKVRAAVQLRLEAQAPYKDAARAMTRALARPDRAAEAARLLWRTADKIWRALGDKSTDENFYSKRAILSGVLASTYARWFADDSDGHEATWAFLDARIENVMQFEKFKARLKPLGEGVESAVGVAARFRYR
ncbi:MAG TPA: COQ9 family protein [Vitreimonas sp.]|uniref:COQ9 family protein n=1 Tax=Vitreimonas sp. TaxID=3069702 RepID=UPI002D6BB48A|nr:COQ9 family protein [Vitreimonas sp.]HYD88858.1 COQ9 family protein [Vitreimonas sp.]